MDPGVRLSKTGRLWWPSLATDIIKEGYETLPLANRTIATMPHIKSVFESIQAGETDLDVGFSLSPTISTSVAGVEQPLISLGGDSCRRDKPPPCDVG